MNPAGTLAKSEWHLAAINMFFLFLKSKLEFSFWNNRFFKKVRLLIFSGSESIVSYRVESFVIGMRHNDDFLSWNFLSFEIKNYRLWFDSGYLVVYLVEKFLFIEITYLDFFYKSLVAYILRLSCSWSESLIFFILIKFWVFFFRFFCWRITVLMLILLVLRNYFNNILIFINLFSEQKLDESRLNCK